jgi:hypothetical protein
VSVADILQLVGTFVVAVSLYFVARQTRVLTEQTRHLARQTSLQADIAGVDTLMNLMRWNLDIENIFIQSPHLRGYFFGGLDPADLKDDDDKVRVDSVAQSLGDLLSTALESAQRLPAFAVNDADWRDYVHTIISSSPALRSLILQHPQYWPALSTFLASLMPTEVPSVRTEP